LQSRHNIQASNAVATETPAMTNAIVPGPTALTESVCTASLQIMVCAHAKLPLDSFVLQETF
jgi:hypothetical protein